jgi:DNA-binding transcriptional LysR family regulator
MDEPLPYLDTFSKAAELGSFTQAAKALNLTQPAVSQRVQALEKILKKQLFRRGSGRVILTDAGKKLYEYAQRIMDLHRQARHEVSGQQVPLTGDLFLAASSIPGEHLLPDLVSVFRRKHPHIRVHATVSDSMGVIAQVEKGEVSLGLVGRKTDNRHLTFRFLARDRMILVVPPDHPLSRKGRVSVKQLCSYPLVLRETGSGLRHCFEKSLDKAGRSLSDLNVAAELGSNEAIREAVLRGVGIAMLSAYALRKELKARRLLAVKVTGLHCDREMFVVQDERKVTPLAARLFLDFLESNPITDKSSL